MAKSATFFANSPVNKHPSTSEVIRRYRSTYEECDLVPLGTSSIGDAELIIHFQETYTVWPKIIENCIFHNMFITVALVNLLHIRILRKECYK